MESNEPVSLNNEATRRDLQAALGARAELGSGMEDHVIDAFLAKVEHRMESLVAARPAPAPRKRIDPSDLAVPSLALSIPLLAITLAMGGGPIGVVAIMVGVLLVNALYVVYEAKG